MAVDPDGIEVHIPLLADLIRNKRASGRTKDIAEPTLSPQSSRRNPKPDN